MLLILGIGNPDEKYKNTRHNAGKRAVSELAEELGAQLKEKPGFGAEICIFEKAILANSLNFMNESGQAAKSIAKFYKIAPENIWIIHDDFDILLGDVRESFGASSAGHNGIKSIIQELGTQKFNRIRIGIKPENELDFPLENFVLDDFNSGEKELINEGLEKAKEKIKNLLSCSPIPNKKQQNIL